MRLVAPPLEVLLLAQSVEFTDRFATVIETAGWRLASVDTLESCSDQSWTCDVIAVTLSCITPYALSWLSSSSSNPSRPPVIVLSPKQEPRTIAQVLYAGADDYLCVPYAAEELLARLGSLVSRSRRILKPKRVAPLIVNSATRTVSSGTHLVTLSRREWRLLIALLGRAGNTVSVDELAERGSDFGLSNSAIISTVSRLRKRLREAEFPILEIETVPGRGYAVQLVESGDDQGQTAPRHLREVTMARTHKLLKKTNHN